MSNPVHKNREKFNRPATHEDKKKKDKKGYKKHKTKDLDSGEKDERL